jgi:glycosyltransferase involved in cell wall biosynthesis
MRALHVFPLFGSELINGSEYYAYMLSSHLAKLGADIDVFALRACLLRPTSAFSLQWSDDYPAGIELVDNLRVWRFSASFSAPAALGRLGSHLISKRWSRETKLFGEVLSGSRNLIDSYHKRALSRSSFYDWIAMLGRGPWSASLLSQMVRDIGNYDVVLVGYLPFALIWQVVTIARYFRKPVLVLPLFHPDDLYHHFKRTYRTVAGADCILAQTRYSAELLSELAPGCNPVVVGAGVDDAAFSNGSASGARFRAKHHLEGKFIVLSVGRKESGKGYVRLLEMIDLIGDDDVILVLIGKDVDKATISSRHTLYLGQVPRPELLDAYEACDVFAMMSEFESFGMVFLEAWMAHKPVIGNLECKPVRDIIRDGVTGFLCASPQSVARRIIELIVDPGVRRAMGEAGFEFVRRRYTWTEIATRVHQLYSELIDRAN